MLTQRGAKDAIIPNNNANLFDGSMQCVLIMRYYYLYA